jgi:hypothetical protein
LSSSQQLSPRRESGCGLSHDLGVAVFSESFAHVLSGERAMKNFLVGTLVVGSLISFEAKAQQRAGDAALGAVSGAVVLGPVGAVAGAIIGYTAGPSIAHSWGLRRSSRRSQVQRTSQTSPAPEVRTTGSTGSPPPAARSDEPPAAKTMPPVQGLE